MNNRNLSYPGFLSKFIHSLTWSSSLSVLEDRILSVLKLGSLKKSSSIDLNGSMQVSHRIISSNHDQFTTE